MAARGKYLCTVALIWPCPGLGPQGMERALKYLSLPPPSCSISCKSLHTVYDPNVLKIIPTADKVKMKQASGEEILHWSFKEG